MLTKQAKYWATFYTPGAFTADTTIEWFDEMPDPNDVEWSEDVYAFTLNEREDVIYNGKVYKGESTQVGPMYYHPDSKVENQEEVARNPNAGQCLLSNMKCNKWEEVIWTRWGNWPQPFDKKKVQILER